MLRLEIVTPERRMFDESVDAVEVPGFDGELGILPGHAELLSKLKPAGILTWHKGDEVGRIYISDGFVEVGPTRVTVLADRAARPEDINLPLALQMKEQAEKALQQAITSGEVSDYTDLLEDVERATLEAQLAESNK